MNLIKDSQIKKSFDKQFSPSLKSKINNSKLFSNNFNIKKTSLLSKSFDELSFRGPEKNHPYNE